MESELFYIIEDDFDVNCLYKEKKHWLESLRYNLDVAVEYNDLSQEECDEIYQNAELEIETDTISANGFYYSIEEIKIVYQSDDLIIRYCECNKAIMVYKLNGKSYDLQFVGVLKDGDLH